MGLEAGGGKGADGGLEAGRGQGADWGQGADEGQEADVADGAGGGLEAGGGQGGKGKGGVDIVDGDNVVDTIIFYTRKAVNGPKLDGVGPVDNRPSTD